MEEARITLTEISQINEDKYSTKNKQKNQEEIKKRSTAALTIHVMEQAKMTLTKIQKIFNKTSKKIRNK